MFPFISSVSTLNYVFRQREERNPLASSPAQGARETVTVLAWKHPPIAKDPMTMYRLFHVCYVASIETDRNPSARRQYDKYIIVIIECRKYPRRNKHRNIRKPNQPWWTTLVYTGELLDEDVTVDNLY